MEKTNNTEQLLELISRPSFSVQNGKITHANAPARERQLLPGMTVKELLLTGVEEYEAFQSGCLYLTVSCAGIPWGATVTKMDSYLLFLLDQDNSTSALQAMSLAAMHMRRPLSEIMAAAESLSPYQRKSEEAARIDQGTYSLLRMIRNMEDVSHYMSSICPMKLHSIGDVIAETVEHAAALAAQAGKKIVFVPLQETVYSMAEPERLKRAVYNLLSNALHATPNAGTIEVCLKKNGKTLYFSVLDGGTGIPAQLQGNLFTAFMREPALNDGYSGLGLGMSVVRAAAASHHGAVLVDFPKETGTRVTITLPIRQSTDNTVRTPILTIDSFGGYDQGLIELADVLPVSVFQKYR